MKIPIVIAALIFCGSTSIGQETRRAPAGQFQTVSLVIDPHGRPLAAYQVDLSVGPATIVGIEAGELPAFSAAPYYDPRALRRDHAIVAAFSLDAHLPDSASRVARVHIFNETGRAIDFSARLIVAAGPDAQPIHADVKLINGDPE